MKSIYLKLNNLDSSYFLVTQTIQLSIFKNYQHATSEKNPLAVFVSNNSYKPTNKFLQKLYTNQPIRDFLFKNLNFKNNDLFEFSNSFLWPKYFIINQYIDLLKKTKSCFNQKIYVIEETHPQLNYIWHKTVKEFCMQHKIQIKFKSCKIKNLFPKARTFLSNLGFRFFKSECLWICFWINSFFLPKKSYVPHHYEKKKFKICFISDDKRYWSIKNKKIFDSQNQKILNAAEELVEKKKSVLYFYVTSQSLIGTKKINGLNKKYFFFSFTEFINFKILYSNLFYFLKSIYGYFKIKHFLYKKIITYSRTKVQALVTCILSEFCFDTSLFCVAYLVIAENLILKIKPDLIFLNYETGPLQRAIIIAARNARIPTVGLQHGMILENHYDYMTKDYDQKNPRFNRSVPNLFFVWGKKWKNILIKYGHYPKEIIKSIGTWK